MKLTKKKCLCAGGWMRDCLMVLWLMGTALASMASVQAVSTTTVQGTVYLANGQPGAGTLDVSWPAFTTANNQAVTAGRITVTIAPDGFMSVNLAPNLGATPAGLYYTAVYHMSDGTTSTEYWVVPASAQAALGQVRAQVMPAAQAIQAVSKAYVDQSIAQSASTLLSATGGTLSGPLYLSGDPTQTLQAADKHYVDTAFGKAVPLAGGNMTGALAAPVVNGVEAPAAGSAQTTLQATISAAGANGAIEIPPSYAGSDKFNNPNGVYVTDLRQTSSQQFERSVKEFGAVCDGVTDDTSALQSAINYAQTHGVALTVPQGTCKTHTLTWHGESIGGMGKQVSALMGFPGQDVLATATDSTNMLSYTRLHDLTIYVDQSVDVSCSAAEGRVPAGSCAVNRPLEGNSIFSQGGNGLNGTAGAGAGWPVGNCAIAMPAATGAGGNGLRVAEIENLEIVTIGVDPMAQYTGAHSTHTCGFYLAQWPQWSEFRNIDIRGLNTGIAMPALPGTTPGGLNADSNRWQNITIQATHGFTAAAGANNVMDDVVVMAGNSAATGEPPTGLVLDLGSTQTGWTVRNAVVLPAWNAVQPQLTVSATGGAVTSVAAGTEHGLGLDPYGTQVPIKFSGSCTAQATAAVNRDGSIGTITVTQGGVGCSGTTTASVNVQGTWDTAAPVNLIGGQNVTLFGGNLLKGNGGYTVWNAAGSQSYGTQLGGGGGTLPGGGTYPALVASTALGSVFQVDQFPGADFGAKLQACVSSLSTVNGGTCDARDFTGNLSMGSNVTISTASATVLMPCATISTANQVVVTAGTRNVALRGCALRGTSAASGSQGGTVLLYSGLGAAVQVGDSTYAVDTQGFHLDNLAINTTGGGAAAKGFAAYRTQEMDVESVYLLGNSNQTGMLLDGTGNYTGGTYFDNAFNGFQTAVNAIGHQISNPATTDWLNASTFVRLHIDCPTSGGSPISGTYGINLQQGDGNTFTGGDVEGCDTALHLGANAQNNTIVGLRNENSNNQVVADAGSSYNNWMTGGTMFTGQLTDNGTRNSFLDTFHRSFNGVNGDWYGSQKDSTVTNHYRLGIGAGNERGLLDRYQTDYGYRWTMGLSDAAAGEQFYQLQDELNNVYRLSIGQYNHGQSSTNNQTVVNAAGTGAVVLNGSNNAGTGGVVFGSGGPNESTVATVSNAGNAQFNGTLQVGGTSTFGGTPTVKNQADAEIDTTLWAGLTASQKESIIYKDWNGNSQWYMVKDAGNNWALNSAIGGLDSIKAYQSTNSGDTYVNASNSSGVVRVNYESGSGTAFNIYGGNSSALYASFTGTSAIKLPGLASGSGHSCLQIDNSGYISNTGSACSGGTGGGGTINSGITGQIAYYTANGVTVGGMNAVPLTAGGTGSSTAAGALTNLGGISSVATALQTMAGPLSVAGAVSESATIPTLSPYSDIRAYGAVIDNATPIDTALQSSIDAATGAGGSGVVLLPCLSGCYLANAATLNHNAARTNDLVVKLQGTLTLGTTFVVPDYTELVCDGGGVPQQFQVSGATCNVQAPVVYGRMGTSVTSTNTVVSFTPTFGSGTAANMPVNSAITIAGMVTCATSSVARTALAGTYPGSGPANVTAIFSTQCRIPPAVQITIAGCADSSFNGTYFSANVDYPLQTLTWRAIGTGTTTSGCSVTGLNADSVETVRITGSTSGVMQATFNRTHSASDYWGMVGVATAFYSEGHHGFQGLQISGNYGVGFWSDASALLTFDNVGFTGIQYPSSFGLEFASSWGWTIANSAISTFASYPCPTASYGCDLDGYPYALRETLLPQSLFSANAAGSGGIIGPNSTVSEGMMIDNGGSRTAYAQGPVVDNSVFEQPMHNAITFDTRGLSAVYQTQITNGSMMQDNLVGWSTASWVGYTEPLPGQGNVLFNMASNLDYAGSTVNKYFGGRVQVSGVNDSDSFIFPTISGNVSSATIEDGRGIIGEVDGIGAGFGPSLIPYSTQPVATNPSSWSCAGTGCSVVTGILAPDGTSTAGEIDAGASSYASTQVYSYTGAVTNPGDWFIYGVWTKGGTGLASILSYGSDVFDQNATNSATTAPFQMHVLSQWWHPIVAATQVLTGNTSPHTINFSIAPSVNILGASAQFWMPFVVYIPASAGVSVSEIERWRQELMHGYVPAGSAANILEVDPSLPIYFGTDTDLYRVAPGMLKTDGAFNAVNGYQVNGSAFSTGNLSDWTDSGVANGYMPMWNSTTNKWTPTAPSGNPVTNTSFTTSTASVAANACNATVQVAMTGVTTSMTFAITPTADTSGATGWGTVGGLVLDTWPTAGYLNYKICNQTASAIASPGAVTFNVSAR